MEKTNKLLWIYLIGFFIILALPLLNLPPWFSPPDWGKTIVFRSILAILLFLFIAQTLVKEKFAIKTSKALWSSIGLLGVFGLATIFSIDPSFSFWGNPYRSGGFLNFASYILFAILAFLVIRKTDWSKILNFSLIIGILISFIAIFQKFGFFPKIFIKTEEPWSTIGGSTFLGVYLLLLFFITLMFTIKSIKNLDRKWFFYFPILTLFLFVIFLTISRATLLGLAMGLAYFFLKSKRALAILLIIIVLLVAWVNIFPSETAPPLIRRLDVEKALNDPRFSVWRISSQGIINKPLLGYGPENFSIAFDKYYDPSLPRMIAVEGPGLTYYDRAHSILFDIGVTAGIPALAIYISLFVFLIYELQKIKKKRPEDALICHSLQALFIAYLTANLFGFDVFSTYIMFFLLVAFSLSLITKDIPERIIAIKLKNKFKYPIIFILFVGLVSFTWFYNIRPFQINTEINKADHSLNRSQMETALRTIDDVLPSNTFLNEYLRATYLEIINTYIFKEPNKTITLAPQGIKIAKQALEIRPDYTRYWILLGNYYNVLLENYQHAYPEYTQEWTEGAHKAFEKANELSPKHQDILIYWARTYIITGDYQTAKEKIQKCIGLNPEMGRCWWTMAEINILSEEIDEAKKNIQTAGEKNYPINSEGSLSELLTTYASIEDSIRYYEEICEIIYKLYTSRIENIDYNIKALACYIKQERVEEAKKLADYLLEHYPKYSEIVNNAMKQLK
ncbi:O-antigen ligase family protein [Patescibacteria group bacterium]|nr:O-antigen ligase family protein [Patescibacteria group bacterium]